jgi:hypothetical protein
MSCSKGEKPSAEKSTGISQIWAPAVEAWQTFGDFLQHSIVHRIENPLNGNSAHYSLELRYHHTVIEVSLENGAACNKLRGLQKR